MIGYIFKVRTPSNKMTVLKKGDRPIFVVGLIFWLDQDLMLQACLKIILGLFFWPERGGLDFIFKEIQYIKNKGILLCIITKS